MENSELYDFHSPPTLATTSKREWKYGKSEWKWREREPWNPCCCGGTPTRWAIVVAIYQVVKWAAVNFASLFAIWGGIIGKTVADLHYLQTASFFSGRHLVPAFVKTLELLTCSLGILSGILLFLVYLVVRTVGIVGSVVLCCLSMLVSLLAFIVICLSLKLRVDVSKWVDVLAYLGMVSQQIYFAFFSYGLRVQLLAMKTKAEGEENGTPTPTHQKELPDLPALQEPNATVTVNKGNTNQKKDKDIPKISTSNQTAIHKAPEQPRTTTTNTNTKPK